MNKTPITVLQELMIKYQEVPSYECIAQTGPQHLSMFEYRCVAHGVTANGVARSKKEAKQEAARRVLCSLAARGLPVPPPYRNGPDTPKASSSDDPGDGEAAGKLDARSYVALLKELCEEFRLGAVQYDLVGDTGPPHLRMFTVRAALASHERVATASTKKAARQMAAEQLYTYLRENLASATRDFVENLGATHLKGQSEPEKSTENAAKNSPRKRKSTDEAPEDVPTKRRSEDKPLDDETVVKKNEEALSRALDRVMSRYVEVREEQPWRPDLGQRIADYHLGEEQRAAAEKVAPEKDSEDSAEVLQRMAAALGLTVELSVLPGEAGDVSVVSLGPAAPSLSLAGRDPPAAARAALRYLRRALKQRPDFPSASTSSPTAYW